ncbi:hypothetical protein Tco_1577301 [Tanacetum coccineum]
MAEESCSTEVAIVPKFDMPHHQSSMSAKDVKSLVRKYNIPLDLHPCAPYDGWTMDKSPEEVIGILPTVNLSRVFYKISKQGHWFSFKKRVGKNVGGKIFNETFSRMRGWKDRFFFIDQRAISDVMAWRHHDSGVNDTLPGNDFSIQDVRSLAEKVIDLRPVHPGLLFIAVDKGDVVSDNHQAGKNTTPPLLVGEPIPDKTDHQLEVEVEDSKVIVAREKKKIQSAKAGSLAEKVIDLHPVHPGLLFIAGLAHLGFSWLLSYFQRYLGKLVKVS